VATTRRASEAIRSGAPYASITSIRVHSIPRDQRLLRVRPKSARQARFVVINFGHYVGCIEGTTRLRSIGLAVLPKLSMLPSSEGAKSVPKATSSSQPLHQPAASPFVLLGGTMPRRDGGPRALILPWRAIRARSETTLARCPAPSSRARGLIGHPLAVERAADQLCPNRLATIVDAGSARLLAVGKRLQRIA
jgi:hypothetical protein